ncbi:extracellular solute-binding protein [Paenibacillus sp. P26]|nr:extracellular solute-binding protein [Paenibacillus sp. P26]
MYIKGRHENAKKVGNPYSVRRADRHSYGGVQQKREHNSPSPASAAPTEISVMTVFYSQEPPNDDNPILKEIEKRTNTRVKISWVSPNSYNDKMNVTLASGDIPDLMLILDPNASTYRSMAQQGAFWDLTDQYKNYQNLAGFPKESWFYSSLEGKNYGIPRVRPVDGDFVTQIRKDWLDKLQLKVPSTTAELYEVLKAFAQNDPDGNGKNDTYGMVGDFSTIEKAFLQSYGARKLIDGKLFSTVFDPMEKDYLTWMANAYKEKLIPEDFAVLKDTQIRDMLKAGKAGVTTVDTLEATWNYSSELRKTVPNADFVATPPLNGIAQKSTGFFRHVCHSKTESQSREAEENTGVHGLRLR